MGGGKIESSKLFRNRFTSGIEGENRVVLMATVKYGLGFHAKVIHENTTIDISFSKFLADAITEQIDYNNDGFTSAEEAFRYSKNKMRPFAFAMLFLIRYQLQTLASTGFLILGFPQISDNYKGELSLLTS